jgi:hypothetical protein
MARRARVNVFLDPVLSISRRAFQQEKIVYILLANKRFKYSYGRRSPIIYVGTSKKGAARIGQSIIDKGAQALESHGVKRIDAYLVTCQLRKKVAIWKKLESALLIVFRERYGKMPRYNSRLSNKPETDEWEYFSRDGLVELLTKIDNKTLNNSTLKKTIKN